MIDGILLVCPVVTSPGLVNELELSEYEQYFLSFTLYLSLGIASIAIISFSNAFGRKAILKTSVCMIIISVLISLFPTNYVCLLLHRILIGLSVGFNFSTSSIYLMENTNVEKSRLLIVGATSFTLGGALCHLFAFILLVHVDCRFFTMLSCMPFLVPLSIVVWFYLPNSAKKHHHQMIYPDEETHLLCNQFKPLPRSSLTSFCIRAVKVFLFGLIRGIPYNGCTVLLHQIMYETKIVYTIFLLHTNDDDEDNEEDNTGLRIHLLVTTVFACGCQISGKCLCYFIRWRCFISTPTILTVTAIAGYASLLLLIYHQNTATFVFSLGLIHFAYSVSMTETYITANSSKIFPGNCFAIASGLSCSSNFLSIAGIIAILELVNRPMILYVYFGFSIVAVMIGLTFYI